MHFLDSNLFAGSSDEDDNGYADKNTKAGPSDDEDDDDAFFKMRKVSWVEYLFLITQIADNVSFSKYKVLINAPYRTFIPA